MGGQHFRNLYFAMRHGESIPNIRGMILSDPQEGQKSEHALTPKGEEQVTASIRSAKDAGTLNDHAIIFSSPFSRCRRTAEIAKEILAVKKDVIIDDRLRERWFGDWEGTSNTNYEKIWAGDQDDPHFKAGHVESMAEVAERVISLIKELEQKYSGKNIILVSHGDALQILQTYFHDTSPDVHRSLPHLATAELRRLN